MWLDSLLADYFRKLKTEYKVLVISENHFLSALTFETNFFILSRVWKEPRKTESTLFCQSLLNDFHKVFGHIIEKYSAIGYNKKKYCCEGILEMLGILFWNTNITAKNCSDEERNNRIEEAIVELVGNLQCDVVVLAEYNIDTNNLCNKLSFIDRDFEEDVSIQESRIKILSDKSLNKNIVQDSEYYIIQTVEKNDFEFSLAGVHFPSKLHADKQDIELVGSDFMRDLLDSEKEVGHEKVVIVGDFNANPFERLVTDAGYIHAIYDASIVEKMKHRVVYRKERQMFYNPMWNFLGDFKSPKGTYYGESGKVEKFFWNIFDQVIISADTINAFDKESLEIITKSGNVSFIEENEKPNAKLYSDHLPIYFSIKEDLL